MTNDSEVIIRLQNLTKNYGHFTAVSNVSLDLPKGEIIGFLGPNGAGKSTTLKIMAGLISPNEGEVFVRNNGELVKLTRNNRDLLLEKMGFLIETPAFYDHMTPREVLTYFAELKGYSRKQIKQRVEEVVKLVGMTKWIDKKIKTFSKGMKQKIGIVSALVHNPDMLVSFLSRKF
ncbi:MAG: ABC transporter ATP-binding protein [Candidatus Thorarchaeota archaeon]